MPDIKSKVQQAPRSPGVYMFKDSNNTIIYIGKATNIFNRVNSYFTRNDDIKTAVMVKKIRDVEFFVTSNEVEALLLENNLIKQHHPRYNIKLRDSKSYPMIKITKESLPRAIKCREKRTKRDEYFGPFVSALDVKHLMQILSRVLKIRPCNKKFNPPYNYTPCLNYYIERCQAPCAGYITENEYLESVNKAREILKGNTNKVIKTLTDEMMEFSEKLDFEAAAKIRDEIKILESFSINQYMDIYARDNYDFVGYYTDFNDATFTIIQQRNGKIIGKQNFLMSKILSPEKVLDDFLNTYYLNTDFFPSTIYIEQEIPELSILEEAINSKFNANPKFRLPHFSKHKRLVIMAKENAELFYEEKKYKLEKIHDLRELKKVLEMNSLPRIIEGFDVATLGGKFNTGAMVHFKDGKPDKSEYRQFNVENQEHPDDYSMMQEVITRRYQKLKNEKRQLPDLILIDGGKGQVNAAHEILEILQLPITIIGLAKKHEHIFKPQTSQPIVLPQTSPALKLLQRVRDEAHRFSNTRLNKRYTKKHLTSDLLKIEGLGEKRINLLLKKFGSIKALINASVEDISSIPGFNKTLSKNILNAIREL